MALGGGGGGGLIAALLFLEPTDEINVEKNSKRSKFNLSSEAAKV